MDPHFRVEAIRKWYPKKIISENGPPFPGGGHPKMISEKIGPKMTICGPIKVDWVCPPKTFVFSFQKPSVRNGLSPQTFIKPQFVSGSFLIFPYRISLSSQGHLWYSFISLIYHSMYHFLSCLVAHPHLLGIFQSHLAQSGSFLQMYLLSHPALDQALNSFMHISCIGRIYQIVSDSKFSPYSPVPFSPISDHVWSFSFVSFWCSFLGLVFLVSSQTLARMIHLLGW